MEEDIKILEALMSEYVGKSKEYELYSVPVHIDKNDIQAIENLINKNEELEEINNILNGVIKSLTKLGEEHMEMINLMGKELAKRKNIMKKVCKECIYDECIESKPKNCVIDYFKKKASEKNE